MPEDHAPERARRWRKEYEEVVVAAVLLLGALFFRLRIDSFVAGRAGTNLDPDFWPGLLLSLAVVLSAIYLVLAVIWARREDQPHLATATVAAPARASTGTEADTTAAPAPAVTGSSGGSPSVGAVPPDTDPVPHPVEEAHTGSVFKLVGGFLLLAAYIYLLGPIGFVPASAIFAVGFMMLVGERRWYVLLIFPVVAITVLLGIFTQLLVVSLPRGTGFLVDLSTYLY